ncbi:unnamed protein product [Prorocentrum cordatum]|uniref:Uncharacterized protein n=1 Tax=Prorocentrum cordatum TaxID=2364126 RepID=A0ABN9QPM5_9DINO|nr:unnamed protein product [Polarella glacialis]|mmetsp:Transcript_49606/g.131776  ORF Transcript_49606/g.131776 Transcript_49606/m.131776 type:complete len:718 (+) Transcript_49606:77-2230(+)
MKRAILALPLLATANLVVTNVTSKGNVIDKVVQLCTELKEKIENDGKTEQGSYDKYACWCEESLGKKANDISKAKETIEQLQTEIVKLKGEQATHVVNVAQLKKDIAAAIESQKEATAIREKESEAYHEEKDESEQCIGALEAAIRVLAGAGAGKPKQLETLQEARLLSVVAGVRGLLRQSAVARSVSSEDLGVVRHFVERPEDFVGESMGSLSAAQVANNPYGDYAPQSTRITGILKGMYDTFTGGLERANAEEATKQKAFEELMATKKSELQSLEATLEQQTMYDAEKTKGLADSKVELDATKEQLEADEEFFAQAKTSCKDKAAEWAERTRMRTEELKGIDKALEILTDEENQKIFANATSASFLQLRSDSRSDESEARNEAYSSLKSLATKYQSISIATVAAALSAGGHFDKVIQSINAMIETLRREDEQDIKEKDWCQGQQYNNKITGEDLEYDIEKLDEELQRAEDLKKELQDKFTALSEELNSTQTEFAELKQMRAEARASFLQSQRDDAAAVALLEEAIAALTSYYQKNKMPIGLVKVRRHLFSQKLAEEPGGGAEEESDPSRPPETSWEEGGYKGSTSEAGGLVAIVELVKEDLEKEILTDREDDARAQTTYEADLAALQKTLDAKKTAMNGVEKEQAELNLKVTGLEARKMHRNSSLSLAQERKGTLEEQCAWVESHFESRRDARKAEIDGLVEAKNYLAGMDDPSA